MLEKLYDQLVAKYHAILEHLRVGIDGGGFARVNGRLPSENELAAQFKVSRLTAGRALRELAVAGLVERRVGSGTYVKAQPVPPPPAPLPRRTFGLLVPGLGQTEILSPVCNEITRVAQSRHATVLWGDALTDVAASGDVGQAEPLCRSYVERGVEGVFFAPIEAFARREEINLRLARFLADHGVAVVLLDRDVVDFPDRSDFDLIGIDNFRAGLTVAEHLLALGHRRLRFVARPDFPATTDLRAAGCVHALARHGLRPPADWARYGDPSDRAFARSVLGPDRPSALVCSNDLTAALLVRTLAELGVKMPDDLAVVGFDDVNYATLLNVPLTTMRQPYKQIGQAAVAAMFERLQNPDLPPREILLSATLVVRASSGGRVDDAPENDRDASRS